MVAAANAMISNPENSAQLVVAFKLLYNACRTLGNTDVGEEGDGEGGAVPHEHLVTARLSLLLLLSSPRISRRGRWNSSGSLTP